MGPLFHFFFQAGGAVEPEPEPDVCSWFDSATNDWFDPKDC